MAVLELQNLKPGPIRHKELPQFLLDIIRWTHSVVGRYVQPTLEQWELGFMRDTLVEREVAFWHRLAFAFIGYHQRLQLPLRSEAEERELVAKMVAAGSGGLLEDGVETRPILDSLMTPDSWKEEQARCKRLLERGGDRWSPPGHLKGWPPSP